MLIGNWPRRRYVAAGNCFCCHYRWPYLAAKFADSRNLPRLQQRQRPKAMASNQKANVLSCRYYTLAKPLRPAKCRKIGLGLRSKVEFSAGKPHPEYLAVDAVIPPICCHCFAVK